MVRDRLVHNPCTIWSAWQDQLARRGTPFPFEGPVPPELLIDRSNELELLGRRAGDRVSVRLVGPRRFGKTSVLLAHEAQLEEVGWRTAHVDLSGIADFTDVARRVVVAYGRLDARWLRSHLSGLLGRLGVGVSATGPAVTLQARPRSPDGQWRRRCSSGCSTCPPTCSSVMASRRASSSTSSKSCWWRARTSTATVCRSACGPPSPQHHTLPRQPHSPHRDSAL